MSVQSYAGIVEDMPGYVPGKGNFLSWALGKVGIGRQSKMLADEFAQKPYGSPNFDQFEAWNEAMEQASKSEPLTNVLDPGFGLQGQYSLESLLPENLTAGEQLGGFNYVQQKVIERAAKVSNSQIDLINARIAGPALNDQMMTRAATAAAYDQRWGGDWMQRTLEAFNQSSSTDRYPTPFMGSTIDLTREEVLQAGGYQELGPRMQQLQLQALGAVTKAAKNPIAMNFAYRGSARRTVRSETTFDAIIAGERTATTRWGNEAEKIKSLNTGDVVAFRSGERTLFAQVTQSAYQVNPQNPGELSRWSKLEGWSTGWGQREFENAALATRSNIGILAWTLARLPRMYSGIRKRPPGCTFNLRKAAVST